MNPRPRYTTLKKLQEDLRSGQITCLELVDYYLGQIEKSQALNIYIEVYAEEARAQAKALDEKITKGLAVKKLFGLVISVKDVICQEGKGGSAASAILENFTSVYTATALQRLLDEDAIVIGRVNCDQFALGSSNENSVYGPTLNALDPQRVPGGSSGGSAVSVQADTCLVGLGSDTGGSVRQPAAFCGIVGMKPTYGRISRYGLLAYASSFDQIGVLAQTVEDAALLLEVMAGPDEFDATTNSKPFTPWSTPLDFSAKTRIAYFDTAINHDSLDPQIKARSLQLISDLREDGHRVEAVDFDYLDVIIPAYYVLTTAEASSNLARYDGIRYGRREEDAKNLMDTYLQSRTEGFSSEVKKRIMLGTFVLSSGYYDAYYTKAQQVRRLIRERTLEIFQEYDFILMPVSPGTAWKIGEKSNDPVEMYLSDIYTVQANMAGIPAIAIPLDDHENGMPFGIQLMADCFAETKMLAFAQLLQAKYTAQPL